MISGIASSVRARSTASISLRSSGTTSRTIVSKPAPVSSSSAASPDASARSPRATPSLIVTIAAARLMPPL
jgi:hypothetical protein